MSHLAGVLGIDSPESGSDDFFTPLPYFLPLHSRYRYTLDPCGHPLSRVTQRILADGGFACILPVDGLKYLWIGHRIFCNPPYSLIAPWVFKALELMRRGDCPAITFLLPGNKTEQPWWQTCVEPYRDSRPHDLPFTLTTDFVAKRIAHATTAIPNPSPDRPGEAGTFGSVFLHYVRKPGG